MSGCIDLEYPFERSWLWEKSQEEVWISMLTVTQTEQRKGHTTRLIKELQSKYSIIAVPTPSTLMKQILWKHGFKYDPNFTNESGRFWVWKKEEMKNERRIIVSKLRNY